MKYLSAKEIAEKWGVNVSLVRRYCLQDRIPKAICKDGIWKIPANAKKPEKQNVITEEPEELSPLAARLVRQKKKKNYHGLYDYVQIDFTYSSSRMASNRLTRQQVESIFRKGKVRESFEPMKVSDLIEVMNHCVCIDYILDNIQEPLSTKFIRKLHYDLMAGTVDERKQKVVPGEYRKNIFPIQERQLCRPETINSNLNSLVRAYESTNEIGLTEILDFHVRFEQIFPFDDGNGRVGRLIMFKECLRHNVMPFILDDKRRKRYLQGIRDWEKSHYTLSKVVRESQELFEAQVDLQKLMEYGDRLRPIMYEEDEE